MERSGNRKLSWFAALLIVIAVCAVSYLLARMFVGGEKTLNSYRVVSLPSNQGGQVLSDGFVHYDGSALGMVNADGATRWSQMVGAGCSFNATDDGVAVWNGSTLMLIDTKKGVTDFSGSMDSEIITAKAGSKYAAVAVKTEDDSRIILLDESGRKLTPYIEMNQSKVVQDGFFSDGTLFWCLTMDANGTTPTTTISTYRPGRSHMGNISNTDQVLYKVLFQSSRIVCVGETYIKTYDYMGEEDTSARRLVYGWYLESADDSTDVPLMAFAANAQYDGGSAVQDVRLIRGSSDQIVRFPFGCQALEAKGDTVYGFSTDGYAMEAVIGSKTVSAYQLPMAIDTVYGVLDDRTAVLGYGREVYLLQLP